MRRLNLKFAAILLVSLILLGAGLFGLHRLQVRRTASRLFEQAKQAETTAAQLLSEAKQADAAKQTKRALDLLNRYLRYRPDDVEALTRYALLLGEGARANRDHDYALSLLNRALGLSPDSLALRRQAMRTALERERYDDVKLHAEKIILELQDASDADKGEAHYGLGRYLENQDNADEAVAKYQTAIELEPDRIDSYAHYAFLEHLTRNNPDKAAQIMNAMVANNPESSQAHLWRSIYREALQKLPAEAASDAARALELAPRNVQALLQVADLAIRREDWDEARRILKRGIEEFPPNDQMYTKLALAEYSTGEMERAREILRQGNVALSDNMDLMFYLSDIGIQLEDLGEDQEPAKLIQKLEQRGYNRGRLGYLKGRLAAARGDSSNPSEYLTNAAEDSAETPEDSAKAREKLARAARKELLTTAITELTAAIPLLNDTPDLAQQANFLLADTYGKRSEEGDLAAQANVYRMMAASNRGQAGLRASLARTLEAQKQLDRALEEYRLEPDKTPEVLIGIARVLIGINLRLTESQRKWDEVETALKQAETAAPDDFRPPVLRAQMLAAQGKYDESQAILDKASQEHPEQPEVWVATIGLAERRNQLGQIPSFLDKAQEKVGDTAVVRIMRARYLGNYEKDKTQAIESLNDLGANLEQYSAEEQSRLVRSLVEAYIRVGQFKQALEKWQQFAKERPENPLVQFLTFELAVRAEDAALADNVTEDAAWAKSVQGEAIAQLRKMTSESEENATANTEGEFLANYAQANQLLRGVRQELKKSNRVQLDPVANQEEARNGPQSKSWADLDEARKLFAGIVEQRRTSSRLPLIEAQISELEGNSQTAADAYVRAIVQLGERDLGVIKHTLELLATLKRYREAQVVLNRIQDQLLLDSSIQRVASELAFQFQDINYAAQEAARIAEESTDYRDHTWLGSMLFLKGDKSGAEQAFRKAVSLAGNDPSPHVTLIQFLLDSENRPKAIEELAAFEKQFPPDQEPLAVAQVYESINNLDRASEILEQAVARQPNAPELRRATASFYIRNSLRQKAQVHLSALVGMSDRSQEDADWAKSLQALLLATDLDEKSAREALAMLGISEPSNMDLADKKTAELRTMARVLVAQSDLQRRAGAERFLKEIIRREPSTSGDDQLLLAKLSESQGNWPQAKSVYQDLLASSMTTGRYYSDYILALMRNKEPGEAEVWLRRLEEKLPNELTTIQLRALLLANKDKTKEGALLLKDYAANHPTQVTLVAQRIERMGGEEAIDIAEEILRAYCEQNRQTNPQVDLILAEFLGRQGKTQEGLDICETLWGLPEKEAPPEIVASSCVTILAAHPENTDQMPRVEAWLQRALQQKPSSIPLLLSQAVFRSLQRDYSESKRIYTEVLKRDPGNVVALNNLAWLIALEDKKPAEAIPLISQAIKQAGAIPALLDTRAVILIEQNEPIQAIRDLETALAIGPEPAMYFHLAQARFLADQRAGAKQALDNGELVGLREELLDPLERPRFNQLKQALAGSDPTPKKPRTSGLVPALEVAKPGGPS